MSGNGWSLRSCRQAVPGRDAVAFTSGCRYRSLARSAFVGHTDRRHRVVASDAFATDGVPPRRVRVCSAGRPTDLPCAALSIHRARLDRVADARVDISLIATAADAMSPCSAWPLPARVAARTTSPRSICCIRRSSIVGRLDGDPPSYIRRSSSPMANSVCGPSERYCRERYCLRLLGVIVGDSHVGSAP